MIRNRNENPVNENSIPSTVIHECESQNQERENEMKNECIDCRFGDSFSDACDNCEINHSCICEDPSYDAWNDPNNERVFNDEKGFCSNCSICGMWHN